MGLDIAQADDRHLSSRNNSNPEKLRTYQQKFFTPAVQKTIALMNILFDWRTRYDIEVEFDE